MAILNPPSYLHNRTDHTAQTDRLAASATLMRGAAGVTWRQGVRSLLDMKVAAQGVPNMTVAVAAGQAFVLQATANQGTYVVTNDASANVTITGSHATLGRRDLVIVRVEDDFFTGVVKAAKLEVVTGTASGSPADPVVTGNYILLARITVAAAVSTITNANITDLRPQTVALGGILPVLTTVERDALAGIGRGMIVDNAETGSLERHNGTTWHTIRSGALADIPWTALTLTNGWLTFGAPYDTPSYCRIDGVVHLKGVMKSGAGNSFTLIAGCRPLATKRIIIVTGSVIGALEITSGGVASVVVGTNASASLDNITFPAEQ